MPREQHRHVPVGRRRLRGRRRGQQSGGRRGQRGRCRGAELRRLELRRLKVLLGALNCLHGGLPVLGRRGGRARLIDPTAQARQSPLGLDGHLLGRHGQRARRRLDGHLFLCRRAALTLTRAHSHGSVVRARVCSAEGEGECELLIFDLRILLARHGVLVLQPLRLGLEQLRGQVLSFHREIAVPPLQRLGARIGA